MPDPKIASEYFTSFLKDFDTVVIGARTFELMARGNSQATYPGLRTYVLSRKLSPAAYPNVTVIGDQGTETIGQLRDQPGKDIWLFGGGTLFGSFAVAGLVDTVEVGIFPVLLGGGKKLMAGCPHRIKLELLSLEQNVMGCVAMKYIVVRS
jgi:dihydrofolate reductase